MSSAFDADFLVIPRGLTSLPGAPKPKPLPKPLLPNSLSVSIIPKAVDSFTTALSDLIGALKKSHLNGEVQ